MFVNCLPTHLTCIKGFIFGALYARRMYPECLKGNMLVCEVFNHVDAISLCIWSHFFLHFYFLAKVSIFILILAQECFAVGNVLSI